MYPGHPWAGYEVDVVDVQVSREWPGNEANRLAIIGVVVLIPRALRDTSMRLMWWMSG